MNTLSLKLAARSTFEPTSMILRPMAGTRYGVTRFFAKWSPLTIQTSLASLAYSMRAPLSALRLSGGGGGTWGPTTGGGPKTGHWR